MAGDQAKTLCLLLREAGQTVWYDNEMSDRSTDAMEEGVRCSDNFLLVLSGEPEIIHGVDTTGEQAIDSKPMRGPTPKASDPREARRLESPLMTKKEEPFSVKSDLDPELANSEWDELRGYTCTDLYSHDSSWSLALRKNELSHRTAVVQATLRLLLLHWLQPLVHFVVFGMYWRHIDWVQQIFGVGIVLREVLYLLSTITCLWVNPAFLLVDIVSVISDHDPSSVWDKGCGFVVLYVVAPEKFVAYALFDSGGLGNQGMQALYVVVVAMLDLCGIGALVAGVVANNLPLALGINYGLTATIGIMGGTRVSVVQVQ
eukprot:COSAG04_NODE_1952_length_5149_cov_76.130099_2_plen_316_part_00